MTLKKADAMVRTRDIKKSDFIEVTATEAADRFDLVRNGQNFKIARDNLIADFGASGPLQTLGEATATPVLSVSGSVNYIRNMLSGSGILTSISPQNGVQLDHRFTVDKSGVPLMINEGADSPTIRSIVAGSGINVSGSGNEIQIAASETPVSSKSVVVYSIDDLPEAVGGIITLAADTEYYFVNDISTASRFIISNATVIKGADPLIISLEYTGTGVMFTGVNADTRFVDINLICSSGTAFDISSTTGTEGFRLRTVGINCENLGSFEMMNIIYFANSIIVCSAEGIDFVGANNACVLTTSTFALTGGTDNMLDLGSATFNLFTLNTGVFNVNSTGYVISGLASSGNINTGGSGTIFNCVQAGSSDYLENLSPHDDSWEMQLNDDIPNSYDVAFATHSTETVTFTAAATPVLLGSTWVEQLAYRFTTTAAGLFTYTGKGTHCEITASISGDIANATDDISFFIYVNGVVVSGSQVTRSFSAGTIGNVSMIWELELATDDYIQLYVQNDDTSVSFNISSIVFRVRS